MLGSINPDYCVMLASTIFLEEWIERGQVRTNQWFFGDGSTTATSPEEEISKEVDRCKGGLYMQIKCIVKSSTLLPDPAVANSRNSLANHSTKKYVDSITVASVLRKGWSMGCNFMAINSNMG